MKGNRRDAEAQRDGRLVVPSAARDLLFRTAAVVLAVLREIFDEAAYARFLERNQLRSSGNAYAAFLREKVGTRPKPRCC
jgi:hypothetical protein